MNTQQKSEDILTEIARLDKRLSEIKSFLHATKTGNINDSLLTEANLLEAIKLLEAINPSEKNMIQALKALIPLAKKSNQELAVKKEPTMSGVKAESEVYNQWTAKLKSKVHVNKMI